MSTDPSPTRLAPADAGRPDTPPAGAFERLSAFDGLFLRSEHLNLMEDYAASLVLAVGAAGGPGVVHGFEATLSGTTLSVSPGLAILADGRPVRTTGVLTTDVGTLAPAAGVYYLVGLRWDTWPLGEEPVQGLLCDTGCGCEGGSTHSARLAEGPFVTVTEADDALDLAAQSGVQRSWLASELFRAEEDDARRWPATEHSLPGMWPPAVQGRLPDTLPLAVLLPPLEGRGWQVDTWAARRDRGSSPPTRHWEWRLGMRPREVFVAQVLQFQAQISDADEAAQGDARAEALRDDLRRLLATSRTVLTKGSAAPEDDAVAAMARQVDDLSSGLAPFLSGRVTASGVRAGAPGSELVELPPAGFVTAAGNGPDGIRRVVEELLDFPDAVARVCECAPGDVGALFEAAQHRDRTRTPRSADYRAEQDTRVIDVFVPSRSGAQAYQWVLFTRAEAVRYEETEVEPDPVTDEVVVIHEVGFEERKATTVGTLRYPPAAWAVPEGSGDVYATVQKILDEEGEYVEVRAQVAAEDRRPLGYLRAVLLAGPFGDDDSGMTKVGTTVVPGAPESITVTTGGTDVERKEDPRMAARAGRAGPAPDAEEDDARATPAAAEATPARKATPRKRTTRKATPPEEPR